jgi:hypothetical protein
LIRKPPSKDYILSWILIGVTHNKLLSNILAFKGGTVLKKFYFEDYRHSEDLDFTLLDEDKTNDEIKNAFETSFEYVKEETNITLSISIAEFGEHETGNIDFYIAYTGPLGGAGKRDFATFRSLHPRLRFGIGGYYRVPLSPPATQPAAR